MSHSARARPPTRGVSPLPSRGKPGKPRKTRAFHAASPPNFLSEYSSPRSPADSRNGPGSTWLVFPCTHDPHVKEHSPHRDRKRPQAGTSADPSTRALRPRKKPSFSAHVARLRAFSIFVNRTQRTLAPYSPRTHLYNLITSILQMYQRRH